jgi:hypothetical protein
VVGSNRGTTTTGGRDRVRTQPATGVALAILSALLVAVSAEVSGVLPPLFDAKVYVKIAEHGLFPKGGLEAPFAYRPLVPFLARGLAEALRIEIPTAFRVLSWTSVAALPVLAWSFVRWDGGDARAALVAFAAVALSYHHLKLPVFLPTPSTIEAYLLLFIAMWALLAGRERLCLALSALGLFAKEFLIIPPLLLAGSQLRAAARTRNRTRLAAAIVTLAVIAFCVALPRAVIPISISFQWVDPIHNPATISNLWLTPLHPLRDLNLLFAWLGYWLPTWLLLTRVRWRALRERLSPVKGVVLGYLALLLLLSMYGGTNLTWFAAYAVPIQVLVLGRLIDRSVRTSELVLMLVAVLLFNRFLVPIPLPDEQRYEAFVDFYGGWSARVNEVTLKRFAELAAYGAAAVLLRAAHQRFWPDTARPVQAT